MKRNYATNRLCQDIADVYDHKHQDLSSEDASRGLSKSAISPRPCSESHQWRSVLHEKFRTIKATYFVLLWISKPIRTTP